jgi:hypothetical protein
MAKAKRLLKPGDALYVPVNNEHICDSDPCNKDNCMLTRALIVHLVATYGGKASDYKVKSTNHGTLFELNGRKYMAVFDTKTASRIYKYDQTYRTTRSKEKARAGVRPFTTRMMIESSTTIAKGAPMSTTVKEHLRSLRRKKKSEVSYVPKTTGTRRELSL